MLKYRVFPRYQVERLKTKVTIPTLKDMSVDLVDISLSGVQIKTVNDPKLKKNFRIILELGGQSLHINATHIWTEFDREKKIFCHGLAIKYYNESSYIKGLNTIKALHMLQQKKNAKNG